MPYKSEAQRGYFHTHEAELKREGVDVSEWDQASKGLKLPYKKKKKEDKSTDRYKRMSEAK